MFKLLPRGAYPQAGRQLIEALRDYERMLEQRPQREDRHYSFRRNRSEFSWQQVLTEFCYDPLKSMCLQRQNWAKIRPDLYVSTHITERDNFVIEVRPTIDTGFRWGGATFLEDNGDFRRFPIVGGGWDRPSNRVLYLSLGDVASSFRANDPWVNHMFPGAQHAPERQLIMLVTKAKLHQLSLYFECYLDRELIEFGPERYIDFRIPTGDQDPKHKRSHSDSMETRNGFDPDRWAPPAIHERLAKSRMGVASLYRFATEYLATLEEGEQVRTYTEYLDLPRTRPATQADVDELFKCATDKQYRAARLLAELAVDSTFGQNLKEHHLFNYFCRNFGFTDQEGLEWIGRHHPAALADIANVSAAQLIAYLRTRDLTRDAAAVAHVDRRMARQLSTDDNYKWARAAALPGRLDTEAREYGFPSFDAFQLWVKDVAPLTWAAGAARAERLTQHIAACEAEALAKRQSANVRRKATLAARKAAAAAEKTA